VGFSSVVHEIDFCLSGPEEAYSSGPSSPNSNPAYSDGESLGWATQTPFRLDADIEVPCSDHHDHGTMNNGRDPDASSVEDFIASYKKPLTQPILPSTRRLRTTKAARVAEDEDWISKRSARLAAKSRFRAQNLKRKPGR
jgi:hypothetical protein